jgi:tetratricopeptide (TPR) repeat protein
LAGKNKMRLTSPGSALAERVAKLPGVHGARLWSWPFEVARRKANLSRQQQAVAAGEMFIFQALPPLWRGRALQFKGEFDGPRGAKANYLGARPTDQQIEDYQLPDQVVKQVPRSRLGQVEAAHILMMREAKQNASFWIGLIFFDQEDYPNAIDFFANRTLGTGTKSRWATSARYNLARAYEAQGNLPKAIELYEADTAGPQSHGNQLRARWLKEKSAAAADEPKST